ncbi:MAG: propionyl-CoA synthetase [Pseudomonadota bacterium]
MSSADVIDTYRSVYDAWARDSEAFWLKAAQEIDWIKPPSAAVDAANAPLYRWFADAECNTCWNAVDRHVEAGRGDQTAIIHDSPITDSQRKITYRELRDDVARLGGALTAAGVGKGDRVVIYMPMIPEAAIAMLACARIGAIHSVVFGGFAAAELAVRLDDATPKAILAASCGLEPGRVVAYKPLIDQAIALAKHKPELCVVYQRSQAPAALTQPQDRDWEAFQQGAEPAPCATLGGADPLYILYTSGTTGAPKGVVRHNAGHMVALKWSMKAIYDVDPGDVYWAASDVGWVVGHSYIVYGPLLQGCTTIMFEGKPVGTPDAGVFWRVIGEHGVKALFTAPTAFRAIRRADPEGAFLPKYDLSSLKALYLAGERADPPTLEWAAEKLGVPIIDHWWQTETGWAICANPMGIEPQPIKFGSPGVPMPGYAVDVLGEDGAPLPAGELGAVCLKLPLPPGSLPTLWNAEDRYRSSYLDLYPGFYETGDAGYIDEDGYLFIMARTDDVINVAGHRLSTGGMEEVLASHPDVAECAVIGVSDPLKGQLPMGFLCLSAGCSTAPELVMEQAIALVRDKIGPVAAFKLVAVVDRLPKTRSGKILRGAMAKIADGAPGKTPATIDDPAILDEIATALKPLGYPLAT